jgi:hypothetical protein
VDLKTTLLSLRSWNLLLLKRFVNKTGRSPLHALYLHCNFRENIFVEVISTLKDRAQKEHSNFLLSPGAKEINKRLSP